MKVTEAIDLLKEAELKQLAIKEDKSAVLGFVNLGILELYKRFRLRHDEVTFTTVDGISKYQLSESDPYVPVDFTDHQLVIIEKIETEDGVLYLNSPGRTYNAKVMQFDTIELPELDVGTDVTVTYRSAPQFLKDVDLEIPLPPQFLEALFNYVGYRGHSSVKGDIKAENNTHYQRFDKSCDAIDWQGLYIGDDLDSTKFTDRGFV